MQGSTHSWIHFIYLRSINGTQKEDVEVAKAYVKAIASISPLVSSYAHV
jgi:thymidylate synthase ThyX